MIVFESIRVLVASQSGPLGCAQYAMVSVVFSRELRLGLVLEDAEFIQNVGNASTVLSYTYLRLSGSYGSDKLI